MRHRVTGRRIFLCGGVMLDLSGNFRAFARDLSRAEKQQVPYAIALTLNATAADIEKNTDKSLSKLLDRPTPFTRRGLFKRKATKRRLLATVGFKPIQASYLERLETGGDRLPKGRALVVPVGQRLNKYGNLPRNALRRLLARKDVFSGNVNGVAGIWQRKRGRSGRGGLKLLIAYAPKARYEKRLGFRAGARKTALARVRTHWRRSFAKAMRTAF